MKRGDKVQFDELKPGDVFEYENVRQMKFYKAHQFGPYVPYGTVGFSKSSVCKCLGDDTKVTFLTHISDILPSFRPCTAQVEFELVGPKEAVKRDQACNGIANYYLFWNRLRIDSGNSVENFRLWTQNIIKPLIAEYEAREVEKKAKLKEENAYEVGEWVVETEYQKYLDQKYLDKKFKELAEENKPAPGRPKANVLVIARDSSFRNISVNVLEKANYRVYATNNYSEGVGILQDAPDGFGEIAVAFVDLKGPRVHGKNFHQHLKEDVIQSDTKLIVQADYTEVEHAVIACSDGWADDFIYKPFDVTQIVYLVEKLLKELAEENGEDR